MAVGGLITILNATPTKSLEP